MLGGGHLVVLGGGRDAQLPQLHVQVLHKGAHPLPYDAEVLVIQLLPFGGRGTEQGPPGVDQVPTLQVLLPVHQEILLLRPYGGGHLVGLGVSEQPQDAQGLGVDGLHGAQQGSLFVQCLAGVGDKDGGDAQDGAAGHLLHKGGGCHVPGGVAPGVVGGPQAPGGEGGGVRLPLDQLLARQLEQGLALHRGGEEGVVLLRSDAGKGLEPMSIVGSPFLQRPILHGVGHHIGGAHADAAAILHHIGHFGKHLFGQALPHNGDAEHICAKQLGDRSTHFQSTLSISVIPSRS